MKTKTLVLCLLPMVILSMTQCDQKNIEAYYEADNQRSTEPSYKMVMLLSTRLLCWTSTM
jgi:hypothetical protein